MKLLALYTSAVIATKQTTESFDVDSPQCADFPSFSGAKASTCALGVLDGESCTHACDNLVTSTCFCTEVSENGLVTLKDGGCAWEQDKACVITTWEQSLTCAISTNFNPCEDKDAFVALIKEAIGCDDCTVVVLLQCEPEDRRRRRDVGYSVSISYTFI